MPSKPDINAIKVLGAQEFTTDVLDAARRRPRRQSQAGPTADAPHGHRSVGTEAADEPDDGRAQDISVAAARPADRAAEPGMGRRHYLRAHGRGPRDSLLKANPT
jgi:hypothetical protein